jgi:putative membrane protein
VRPGFFVHEPPAPKKAPQLPTAPRRSHPAPAPAPAKITPGSYDWSFIPGTKTQAPDLAPFDPRVWENHNSVLIGAFLLGALYLWAVGPLRRKKGWAPKFPVGRAVTFFVGLVVMLVSLNGPLHDLSDYYLFSIHMVQHLMLTQIMAPLLILGLPAWLVAAIVARPGFARAARFFGHPLIGGGLFIVAIIFWHLIPFYDLMMRNHNIHIATHLMFMVTAVMAWWPVCCALPSLRINEPAQMLYLFLLGVPMQIVAAVITLSDQVLYPWYATAPRTWGLSPLDDQQLGGLLMWVPGGLGLWIAITAVWLVWARRSGQRGMGPAPGAEAEPPLSLPKVG